MAQYFPNFVFRFKEVISLLIFIGSFLITKFSVFKISDDPERNVLGISSLLNFCILIFGLILIYRVKNEKIIISNEPNSTEEDDSIQVLYNTNINRNDFIEKREKFNHFVERSNKITNQLCRNLVYYIFPLIIFYFVHFIKDFYLFTPISKVILDSCSSFEQLYSYDYLNFSYLSYLFTFIVLNATNLLSAFGLFFCFQILYFKTLDDQNVDHLGYAIPLFIFSAYIILFFYAVLPDWDYMIPKISLSYKLLAFDFISGIMNGIAMVLFFNRLAQVFYFFQIRFEGHFFVKWYYITILTVVFPLYACVQPFFTLFEFLYQDSSGLYAAFKSATFFITFAGKLSLFFMLYMFIKTKWLNTSILILLTYERKAIEVADVVASISDNYNEI